MKRLLVLLVALAACGGGAHPTEPTTPTKPDPKPEPAPSVTTWDKLTGPIQKIVVKSTVMSAEIEAALKPLSSKPLDRFELRDKLAVIMAMRGVADAVATGVQRDGGIELVVAIKAQPPVRSVKAADSTGRHIDLKVEGIGNVLVPKELDEVARRMRDDYLEHGFLEADAHWKTTDTADGGVDVLFEIVPGEQSTVAAVQFTGTKAVAAKDLATAIAKTLPIGDPVHDEAIEKASLEISAFYWDRGYANIHVKSPEPVAGKNTLVFVIEEGGKFKIGKIKITGFPPEADHPKLLKLFGVKTGDVFSRTAIANGRTKVADETKGNVLPLTKVDLAKLTIDLTLEIDKQ